jgi:peptidyl-dipeptidase A
MRNRTRFLVAALAVVLAVSCKKGSDEPAPGTGSGSGTGSGTGTGPSAADAKAFADRADKELREKWIASQLAEWDRMTNITPETKAKAAAANEAAMQKLTELIREGRTYDGVAGLDPDTKRQLHLLKIAGQPAPDDPAKAAELAKVMTEMDSLYGEGKACDAAGKNCRDLEVLTDVMAKNRKPAELLAAWQGWHAVGKTIKPHYEKFVTLANEGAKGVGFDDVGAMWRSRYDMPPAAMVAESDRLWGQVKPLYDQLHCYVRRKLNAKYGDKVVPATGPMPAHVLGNMWAQSWEHVYDLVEPYPGKQSPDVTPALEKQKYDPVRMTRLAEGFFTSLGLPALPQTFWERSMFEKPKDKEVVCHASAWDPHYNGDVRIKMCVKINQTDLVTLHHELGHDYYYLHYFEKPVLYQDGANDGFHEAIGDTIALSMTPAYLKQVGLLDSVAVDEQAVINAQLNDALSSIAFLPWGLLVDKWRWEVFAGKVQPADYTKRWWELRREYQGIVPPIERTADDFDPGAKYHVPGNTPYMRYFLARILQFQFHRALCETAGHKGSLHECSIYGSKEAGKRLAATLALGSSKPWPDALEALTGTREMDAGAILEYFKPLDAWLAEQNKGQTCGW